MEQVRSVFTKEVEFKNRDETNINARFKNV